MPAINSITRTHTGRLPAYAFPGGYPILYHSRINSTLCPHCANRADADPDELPAWRPTFWSIHYEGLSAYCDDCGREIESAYGEPDHADAPITLRHADGTELTFPNWPDPEELADPDGWTLIE